jgi:hypothetical protein
MYLSYISSLEFDDFAHWTEEDFQYYNRICYPINIQAVNRDRIYKQVREAMSQVDTQLYNDVFFLENYGRFNQWVSVVFSRSHTFSYDEWKECRSNPPVDPMNTKYQRAMSTVIIPLIDFANHKQPEKAD